MVKYSAFSIVFAAADRSGFISLPNASFCLMQLKRNANKTRKNAQDFQRCHRNCFSILFLLA